MKQVHFIVQGKGGVGKSLISTMLAQYLVENYLNVYLFDTDPVNQTFSRYKALNVEIVNIAGKNNQIDQSQFDLLIEDLIERDGVGVVDNGSTTFLPLMHYIEENGVIDILEENGVEVIFHIPLQGGSGFYDTAEGLRSILEALPVKTIVWLNHNQGELTFGGKHFTESKAYQKHAEKIIGVCEIINRHNDLFDKDIQRMSENHLTIAEIKEITNNTEWRLMSKQRLMIFYKDICEQLHQIPLFAESTTE